MKRNETVLVYAVTGLLLVILLVAVVFGSQPANAKRTEKRVAGLPGGVPALMGGESDPDDGTPLGGDPSRVGEGSPVSSDPGKANPVPGSQGGDPNSALPIVPADDTSGGESNPSKVYGPEFVEPQPLKAVVDLPAQRLERTLGPSKRDGDYRRVPAWSGATLHMVVERWCGDAARMEEVQTINETLGDNIQAGDEILVPWVDAETLLTAYETREASRKKIDWAKGEAYKLRKGDSLWKVASKRVARNQIPAWLERFKVLNPEISDLGALVEGQMVRLPR